MLACHRRLRKMIREANGACTLEIRHIVEREGYANRVENSCQVNEFLGDGAFDWREPTERCGYHSDDAETHATQSAEQRDRTHPAADVHQLVYFAERCVEDHCIGGLR